MLRVSEEEFDLLTRSKAPIEITPEQEFDVAWHKAYTVTVLGVPVPKGRHRARIVQPRGRAPFIQFYQDADTEKYEDRVREASRGAMLSVNGATIHDTPIKVIVRVFLPLLSSWSKKKCAAALRGEIAPAVRPDIDNYVKAALDGMNGVIFKDDGLVTDLHAAKHYSDNPRLVIDIFNRAPMQAQERVK